MYYYLDTSSVIKLFVKERESRAMQRLIAEGAEPHIFHYSFMTKIETLRNLRNLDLDLSQATSMFSGWTAIRVTKEMLSVAESISPKNLKTPDAIHLASALQLTPMTVSMITYDRQLAKASVESGIQAFSPGL
jgi:hypothetical protein